MKVKFFVMAAIVVVFAVIIAALVTPGIKKTTETTTEETIADETTAEETAAYSLVIEAEPDTEPETKPGTEPATETETETEVAIRDDLPSFKRAEDWSLNYVSNKVFFVEDPAADSPWGQAFAAAKAKIAETASLRGDAVILAHCIRGEASVIPSRTRAVAVAEMVLNQVDYNEREFAKIRSVKEAVVERPNNIRGYWLSIDSPVPLDQVYLDLAIEVMARREMERQGWEWSGRILPAGYVFEYASGGENYFMPYEAYHDLNEAWNWDLPTPYRS